MDTKENEFHTSFWNRKVELFSACFPNEPLSSSDKLPMRELRQPSYRLAIRLKEELASGWQNSLASWSSPAPERVGIRTRLHD